MRCRCDDRSHVNRSEPASFSAHWSIGAPNIVMARTAKRVVTEQRDIERIEGLVVALPSQSRVRVTLRNGDIISGTVIERPATQVFEDPAGNQGINSVLRLDDPSAPVWQVYLWLSDIESVEQLPPHAG
jgi:hypothetical protein